MLRIWPALSFRGKVTLQEGRRHVSVVSRAVGSAALAGVVTITAFVIAVAGSWISGWAIRVPGLLTVSRASDNATDGVIFDPNAFGLLLLGGLLAVLMAAWRPAAAIRDRR